jgi:hypothetical protein
VAIIVRSKKAEIPSRSAEIAVLKLAAIVRRADRQLSLGFTRAELRAFLQETERLSTGLASKLHDVVLAKALRQAVVSHADAASWEATGVALDGLAKTKRYLGSLSSALRHSITALGLTGRSGPSGPFQRSQIPPTALLVIFARRLFEDLGFADRRPTKRADFVHFLECVWLLAVPSSSGIDCETAGKRAAGSRDAGISPEALVQCRLSAGDFTKRLLRPSAEQIIRGLNTPQKP